MTKQSERDQSIDALLRRQREPLVESPGTGPCVDAETLAAWMDGALSGDALAAAEHHAAGCARCQMMLASMARTAPEPAARPWWRPLTVRWLVPAAAAAIAAVVWVSVAHAPGAPAPAATSAPADRTQAAVPADPPLVARDEAPRIPASSPDSEPKAKAAASAPRPLRSERPRVDSKSDSAVLDGVIGGQSRDVVTPPPPAAEPFVPRPIAETVTVAAESSALVGRLAGRGGGAGGGIVTATVQILSPEPAFRWRLSTPAVILRSIDGGLTWTLQAGPAGFVLTAGSSPARDVCWIVGRAGAVGLSTDGATWQRRPFPEAANLAAVRAIDAKTAVVTTEDGRQFSTVDGGATWARNP